MVSAQRRSSCSSSKSRGGQGVPAPRLARCPGQSLSASPKVCTPESQAPCGMDTGTRRSSREPLSAVRDPPSGHQ